MRLNSLLDVEIFCEDLKKTIAEIPKNVIIAVELTADELSTFGIPKELLKYDEIKYESKSGIEVNLLREIED